MKNALLRLTVALIKRIWSCKIFSIRQEPYKPSIFGMLKHFNYVTLKGEPKLEGISQRKEKKSIFALLTKIIADGLLQTS